MILAGSWPGAAWLDSPGPEAIDFAAGKGGAIGEGEKTEGSNKETCEKELGDGKGKGDVYGDANGDAFEGGAFEGGAFERDAFEGDAFEGDPV